MVHWRRRHLRHGARPNALRKPRPDHRVPSPSSFLLLLLSCVPPFLPPWHHLTVLLLLLPLVGVVMPRCSMGTTSVSRELFIEMLDEMRPRYNMMSYDLINNNCNNFTNEVVTLLTGRPIPECALPLSALELGRAAAPDPDGLTSLFSSHHRLASRGENRQLLSTLHAPARPSPISHLCSFCLGVRSSARR